MVIKDATNTMDNTFDPSNGFPRKSVFIDPNGDVVLMPKAEWRIYKEYFQKGKLSSSEECKLQHIFFGGMHALSLAMAYINELPDLTNEEKAQHLKEYLEMVKCEAVKLSQAYPVLRVQQKNFETCAKLN